MKKLSVTEMKIIQGGGWIKNAIIKIRKKVQRRNEIYDELSRLY